MRDTPTPTVWNARDKRMPFKGRAINTQNFDINEMYSAITTI